MSVRTELGDLIRAMARRDWGTVDRLLDELESSGWHGGSQMIGAAFAIAANDRFPEGQTPTDVARLVAETRSRYPESQSLPVLQMEGMVRAALGESDLAQGIDAELAMQIQIVILGKLLQDADFNEQQLETFVAEVEQTAAEFM